MIFMSFEINKIDLEAIIFRIFKIPVVKVKIFGLNVFCKKALPQGRTDLTETNFKFYKKQHFWALL